MLLTVLSCLNLYHWRGHQTSATVASLKGRLPQKLQSKSTLSCEIVQIHSLIDHGFIKKPKSKFNRNILILFSCDRFRQTDLGIDLLVLQMLFQGRYNTQDYFRYFLHLFSVPSFIFSKNGNGLILLYPHRIV